MNHESIDLEPLCVERVQVKEVLKALIHSIIFQRALGAPLYRDTESDVFDITYMRCDSHLIDSKVEALAEAFSSGIDADAAADVRTTCCLSFFERRSSSAAFGWLRSEEAASLGLARLEHPFRVVRRAELRVRAPRRRRRRRRPITSAADAERAARHNALEATLRQQIEFVLSVASAKREHISPADGLGGDTIWFEISSTSADAAWSGLDMMRQLLSSASPPTVGGRK